MTFSTTCSPEMFPPARVAQLDSTFTKDAVGADLIIVSSEASRADFDEFLPDYLHKVRTYHFPSRFVFEPSLTGVPVSTDTAERYGIDSEFLLVVNQFWQHKNHDAVVEACARAQGPRRRLPAGRDDRHADR